MLDRLIAATGKLGEKNLTIKRRLLRNKALNNTWQKFKFLLAKDIDKSFREASQSFFRQNTERVNQITSWLADEESKKTFLKMIAFRSRGKRAGFIRYHGGDSQYFLNDFFKFHEKEVFIDCGAYTGDTVDVIVSICPAYDKIIAFEPDPKNYATLSAKHGANPKMVLFNTGVSDHDGDVQFTANGTSGSVIVTTPDETTTSIQVRAIDSIGFDRVTFIKMDIEGAELQALQGARKTILRDRPKLAICIYHSNEDMLRLAEYIHGLVPEYRLWVRQHHPFQRRETVLYAQAGE